MYDLFKRMLGSGPVYAALGNHDSYNQLSFHHGRRDNSSNLRFLGLKTRPIRLEVRLLSNLAGL